MSICACKYICILLHHLKNSLVICYHIVGPLYKACSFCVVNSCTYFSLSSRCTCNFFSICSIGNWGTSYGAEISLVSSLSASVLSGSAESMMSPVKYNKLT